VRSKVRIPNARVMVRKLIKKATPCMKIPDTGYCMPVRQRRPAWVGASKPPAATQVCL